MTAVQEEKVDDNVIPVEEAEELENSVLDESFFETKFDILEQEHQEEEIILQKTEEKNVKVDYQEIQMQIILSDNERKTIWEEYKLYVDELVLIGLQDATFCRLLIYIK